MVFLVVTLIPARLRGIVVLANVLTFKTAEA
jgi:hypothetical protein